MKGGRPTFDYAFRGGQVDNPNASVMERAVQKALASQRSGGQQTGGKGATIKASIGDVVCIENTSTATADRPLVYLPKIKGDMTGKSVWVTFAVKSTSAYYRLGASDNVNNSATTLASLDITAPDITHQYFCAGPEYGWRFHVLSS